MDTIESLGTREKLKHIIISRGGLENIRSITGFMGGKVKRNRNGACSVCGCEIPPGRDGRKCKKCRETPAPSIHDIDLIYTHEFTAEELAEMERHEREGTAKIRFDGERQR